MSSALALKQLKSLQESRERPDGSKEIKKAIRNKRRSNKKQSARAQQQAAKQQQSSKLEYYKATTSTQRATAEIMSKVHTKICFANLLCLCGTVFNIKRVLLNLLLWHFLFTPCDAAAGSACTSRRRSQ
jgi:hypothetical protein